MTFALVACAGIVVLVLAARQTLHMLARRFNWRIGRWSDVLPGWSRGRCLKCRTSFAYVHPHDTPYMIEGGRAVFPLCDLCWRELGGPAARIPYYEELFETRVQIGIPLSASDITAIRAAVAAGL